MIDVVFHLPQNEQELNKIKQRVAMTHAEIVTHYINCLFCPREQKMQLLKSIREEFQAK